MALVVSACSAPAGVTSSALRTYVDQVEKVRLPVNQLLQSADPIINASKDHSITPIAAEQRMDVLERQFATYVVAINAIAPHDARLARIHAPYARTFLLEDTYLSVLAADLVDGRFDNLPTTQNEQRLAIITWRVQLELLARRAGVTLPDDIEQAGRGEIAPSPGGS
ncbi:MAG: hypothetical protein ACYDH6_15085 [Acidimicrobiales bacterium]